MTGDSKGRSERREDLGSVSGIFEILLLGFLIGSSFLEQDNSKVLVYSAPPVSYNEQYELGMVHLLDLDETQPVNDPEVLAMVQRLKKWGGITDEISVVSVRRLLGQADIHREDNGRVQIRVEDKYIRYLDRRYLQTWLAHELGHLYCGHIDSRQYVGDQEQAEADAFAIKMVGVELFKEDMRATTPYWSRADIEARIQRAIAIGEPPRRMGHTNTYARMRPR